MERITSSWYAVHIELALLKKKEQEYEDVFCWIMEKKHGTNFQRVKAAGRDGDAKSDGFLFTEKCVFQSYAPSSGFQKAKLLAKIEGDFEGAKERWGKKMEQWAFVHNETEGLPPYAHFKIMELDEANADIAIQPSVQPSHLKVKALSLDENHLAELFGPALSYHDVTQLNHEPVKYLLRAIQKRDYKVENIQPVSVNKLQYNQLSNDIEVLLTAGRRKEKLVEDLLINWPDPEYGNELSAAFISKYRELVSQELSPDEIFMELKTFAGGDSRVPSEQVSALAVLSYFFERCDIFENAPEGWSP